MIGNKYFLRFLFISLLLSSLMVANAAILFSDDFNNNALDTSKWTTAGKDSQLTFTNGHVEYTRNGSDGHWGASLITKNTFNYGIKIQYDWQTNGSSPNCGGAENDCAQRGIYLYESLSGRETTFYNSPQSSNMIHLRYNRHSSDFKVMVGGNGISNTSTTINSSYTAPHNFEWHLNADSYKVFVDGVQVLAGAITNSLRNFTAEVYNGNHLLSDGQAPIYKVDNFVISSTTAVPEANTFILVVLACIFGIFVPLRNKV